MVVEKAKKKKSEKLKSKQNSNMGFTEKEISFLKTLNTVHKMQDFLDTLTYNKGRRLSIVDVFRQRKGDCIESASFASYVFRLNKIDNFLMDLKCFDDADHVVCVYKKNGYYGSVAQSLYIGLRNKSPVYRNLRELALSYFEHFFTHKGILDLRMYSVPVSLPKKEGKWLWSKRFMYEFEQQVDKVRHIYLVPKNIQLNKVSKVLYQREFIKLTSDAKIGKEYVKCARKIERI